MYFKENKPTIHVKDLPYILSDDKYSNYAV